MKKLRHAFNENKVPMIIGMVLLFVVVFTVLVFRYNLFYLVSKDIQTSQEIERVEYHQDTNTLTVYSNLEFYKSLDGYFYDNSTGVSDAIALSVGYSIDPTLSKVDHIDIPLASGTKHVYIVNSEKENIYTIDLTD